MLMAAGGSAFANVAMGALLVTGVRENIVLWFAVLYGVNMYFQSFGAVSIVKVNAAWFHLRERGTFGGIFGILISLGLYFAFDWCAMIAESAETEWVFFIPAALLVVVLGGDLRVRARHARRGRFADFDPGDAWPARTRAAPGSLRQTVAGIARIFKHDAAQPRHPHHRLHRVLQRLPAPGDHAVVRDFAKQRRGPAPRRLHRRATGACCCAARASSAAWWPGVISDHVFQSRRGPCGGALRRHAGGSWRRSRSSCMIFAYQNVAVVGWIVVVMSWPSSACTACSRAPPSMDFGGKH
jgi:OPA family glycerol-3-phosphate transporter-like MFS transporter